MSDLSWVKPGDLKPWPKNPRKNDDAVTRVAESIRRFGFGAPIVARKENSEIIAGHTRWKAARMLKLDKVPVRFLDVNERDAHILALADNKLGEVAEWDKGELAEQLSNYSLGEADLAGWGAQDLAALFSAEGGGDTSEQLGGDLTYSVVIECDDEEQQAELMERFDAEGLRCKPLIS